MRHPQGLCCPKAPALLMLAVCRHVPSEDTSVQSAAHLQTSMLRVLTVSVTVYSTYS